ncbi:response regulator [Flavihumibacter stibioxidans]|uniref:DNA-binding response regulator n=1 Tax=Flavihumibacter stibioxidans TaxID=1834163 RepID=A0ABR7M469_9BACT|nr:response regulator transcription factor [Flavihumibacter stibioxidans]MBC6489767.1 DNA-binding response regulator [Flavihumibacter stibioxidans]
MAEQKITMAIADDHLVVVNGIRAMLSRRPEVSILFDATDGDELLSKLTGSRPDVLLLDIQMPGLSGVDLCRKIHKEYPEIAIIALTSHDESHFIRQMIRNGALGYLLKTTGLEELMQAIESVMEGRQFVDAQIRNSLVQEALTGQRISQYEIPLTRREKEILKMIASELSNQEIADSLCISLRTVETHRFNITQKLDVKNTAGLVKEAIKRGLVE